MARKKSKISSLRKRIQKLSHKAGLPPGSLVFTGQKRSETVKLTSFHYNKDEVWLEEISDVTACKLKPKSNAMTWLRVEGLHDVEKIKAITDLFNLHPLMLEDILNTSVRTKVEITDDYLFVSVKWMQYNEDLLDTESFSFILSGSYLVSFHEGPVAIFDSLLERIQTRQGLVRNSGTDFLLYRLLDLIVDQYLFVTDQMTEIIENTEDETLERPDKKTMLKIQNLKKDLMLIHRNISSIREVVSTLSKSEISGIENKTRLYFSDITDHIYQVTETIEYLRNILSDLMGIYLNNVSNKLNEVMKVLTIISTIFIPLSFIAGIYGMNFDTMPELHLKNGYPAVLISMGAIMLGMVYYFKRKGWF